MERVESRESVVQQSTVQQSAGRSHSWMPRLRPALVPALPVLVAAGFVTLAGSASAQQPAAADPAAAQKIAAEVCAACHAADGNSTIPANPKLAAQHPAYLFKQLKDFKPAGEGKKAVRDNAVMAAFASTLSEQDMRNLAAFYGGQTLKPTAARNKELVELGREIYRAGIASKGVPACAACHGPTGSGIPDQYPRLSGQYADYTEAQLTAFQAGTRANNPTMAHIAERMTPREVKAVSDYIAGLR